MGMFPRLRDIWSIQLPTKIGVSFDVYGVGLLHDNIFHCGEVTTEWVCAMFLVVVILNGVQKIEMPME